MKFNQAHAEKVQTSKKVPPHHDASKINYNFHFLAMVDFPSRIEIYMGFGWLVGFNGPLRQYFSLYRPQTSWSPPVIFIAGRPKAALLFWFFGDFRCGALLFMIIHVIYKYKNRY